MDFVENRGLMKDFFIKRFKIILIKKMDYNLSFKWILKNLKEKS